MCFYVGGVYVGFSPCVGYYFDDDDGGGGVAAVVVGVCYGGADERDEEAFATLEYYAAIVLVPVCVYAGSVN